MEPPVYVYYELDGFYQNHRRCARAHGQALQCLRAARSREPPAGSFATRLRPAPGGGRPLTSAAAAA
jgi:hypothetical protein